MRKICSIVLLAMSSVVLLVVPLAAQSVRAERWKKFNDAKFGMFIHWGPYAAAGVEASWPIMEPKGWNITEAEYRALPARFNPVKFDPDAWVHLAQAAGQRYLVFTAKHHDGFIMYDSAFTDYKITQTPYRKDVLGMLAEAARREVMPLGFYYSLPDLNHTGYRDTTKPASANFNGEPTRPEWPLYLDYMELQIRELLTRYGDVFVMWFDGWNLAQYDGARFQRVIRELQPETLINNRIGPAGDFVTPEQRLPKGIPCKGARVGTLDPNDEGIGTEPPPPGQFQPWEACLTINKSWAYNPNDRDFKSATELIRALIDVASKGGNLLLDVGPTGEGLIQPEFEQRLLAMGAWLKVNGEAIYGTTYGPLQSLPFGRTTAKGKIVYLHLFSWPGTQVELRGLHGRLKRAKLLSGNRPVSFSQSGGTVSLDLKSIVPDPAATVLALQMK